MAHDVSLALALICFRDVLAKPGSAPTIRPARVGVAVNAGCFGPIGTGGKTNWLGAGAQRLARRVVYQLNSRSVLRFFWRGR